MVSQRPQTAAMRACTGALRDGREVLSARCVVLLVPPWPLPLSLFLSLARSELHGPRQAQAEPEESQDQHAALLHDSHTQPFSPRGDHGVEGARFARVGQGQGSAKPSSAVGFAVGGRGVGGCGVFLDKTFIPPPGNRHAAPFSAYRLDWDPLPFQSTDVDREPPRAPFLFQPRGVERCLL